MAEMSRLMGVAPSTLVYVVDGLRREKAGETGQAPKDRRRGPLLLEKKGVQLFARFPKLDAGSTLVRCPESMPASQRRELLAILYELVKELTGSERMYLPAGDVASGSKGAGHGRCCKGNLPGSEWNVPRLSRSNAEPLTETTPQ
jgi:hypothetical protein